MFIIGRNLSTTKQGGAGFGGRKKRRSREEPPLSFSRQGELPARARPTVKPLQYLIDPPTNPTLAQLEASRERIIPHKLGHSFKSCYVCP